MVLWMQLPLGLAIVWAYAFLLTETGRYNYKGCPLHTPVNGTISANCTEHVFTMQHCRTDVSNALKKSSWFRFPYPFQWGAPSFHWGTGVIMIAASIIATVDSVSTVPSEFQRMQTFLNLCDSNLRLQTWNRKGYN